MNPKNSSLYRRFISVDKGAWLNVTFAAFAAGLMQGYIVVIINQASAGLIKGGLTVKPVLLFILAVSAYSLASRYSTSRTIALTETVIFSMYVSLAEKIRNARTEAFERIGKAEIYSSLHTNTDIVLETSKSLAGVGAAVIMIVFCAAYIAYLSRSAVLTAIVFYAFGIFVYTTNLKRIRGLLKETNDREDRFREMFRFFLEGFKEIKVDRVLGDDLLAKQVRGQSDRARESRIKVEDRLAGNAVFIQAFYYCMVAAMIFLLPKMTNLDGLTVVKIAVVILFSYGSMTRIVLAAPMILKSERAVDALDRLERNLTAAREPSGPPVGRFDQLRSGELRLGLEEATFHYSGSDRGANFSLGPISLDIEPGRIVFIVGGNGSGKTTLLKILAGLYYPEDGRLTLAGQPVDNDSYDDYRDLFSVIFPDYYLFDQLYGREDVEEEQVEKLLTQMGLADRVGWREGRFSDLKLSAGQSKRLALAVSHLKDKPFLVIDEAAADLDPEFRKYFYEQYLQELKALGKTIIAVSHDERYFHTADRIIKLENGRIVADRADGASNESAEVY